MCPWPHRPPFGRLRGTSWTFPCEMPNRSCRQVPGTNPIMWGFRRGSIKLVALSAKKLMQSWATMTTAPPSLLKSQTGSENSTALAFSARERAPTTATNFKRKPCPPKMCNLRPQVSRMPTRRKLTKRTSKKTNRRKVSSSSKGWTPKSPPPTYEANWQMLELRQDFRPKLPMVWQSRAKLHTRISLGVGWQCLTHLEISRWNKCLICQRLMLLNRLHRRISAGTRTERSKTCMISAVIRKGRTSWTGFQSHTTTNLSYRTSYAR